MATTWILHTETKGTGAQMVPLQSVKRRPAPAEPLSVPRKPARRRKPDAPQAKTPRRFRIVDVMTRRVLLDDAGTRAAVDALRALRSVDVNVYTWHEGLWRLLTLGEQGALIEWAHAHHEPTRPGVLPVVARDHAQRQPRQDNPHHDDHEHADADLAGVPAVDHQ